MIFTALQEAGYDRRHLAAIMDMVVTIPDNAMVLTADTLSYIPNGQYGYSLYVEILNSLIGAYSDGCGSIEKFSLFIESLARQQECGVGDPKAEWEAMISEIMILDKQATTENRNEDMFVWYFVDSDMNRAMITKCFVDGSVEPMFFGDKSIALSEMESVKKAMSLLGEDAVLCHYHLIEDVAYIPNTLN